MGFDVSDLVHGEPVAQARRQGPSVLDAMASLEARGADEPRPLRRGPIALARALVDRIVRAMLHGGEPRAAARAPCLAAAEPAASGALNPEPPRLPMAALLLADRGFVGVRVLDEQVLAVVWRVREERLQGARALAPSATEIHLRTVRVAWPEGAAAPRVVRSDHGVVSSEGALALAPRAPDERIVAALGLLAPDGTFVAIDHATQG